jgi:hypothetical protein
MQVEDLIKEDFQERFVQSRYEDLVQKVSRVLKKFTPANREMMVRFRKRNFLLCSSQCFEAKEFELVEAQACQERCEDGIRFVDMKTQVAFARFDRVVNGCFHSCTKQRRKSAGLSGDVVNCYNDCFNSAEGVLGDLDLHLNSLYSKYCDIDSV